MKSKIARPTTPSRNHNLVKWYTVKPIINAPPIALVANVQIAEM